jgi:predicted RNase H-like HicB family nuclease
MWYHKFMNYVFSAIFTKEQGGYSVVCPELGVASQGEDMVAAEKNIKEAVKLYIEDMKSEELEPYSQGKKSLSFVKTFEVSHA